MQNATNSNISSNDNDCSSSDLNCNITLKIVVIILCVFGFSIITFFTIKFMKYKSRQNSHIITKTKETKKRNGKTPSLEIMEEVPNSDPDGSKVGFIEINSTLTAADKSRIEDTTIYAITSKDPKNGEENYEDEEKEDGDGDQENIENRIDQDLFDVHEILQEKGFSMFQDKTNAVETETVRHISELNSPYSRFDSATPENFS